MSPKSFQYSRVTSTLPRLLNPLTLGKKRSYTNPVYIKPSSSKTFVLVWQEHATSYRLLKNWQMSHGSVVAATARDDPAASWTCQLLQRAAGPASPICTKWSPQEHTQTLWAFNWRFFSHTLRKCTTKNPAGIFSVSKAWSRLLSLPPMQLLVKLSN